MFGKQFPFIICVCTMKIIPGLLIVYLVAQMFCAADRLLHFHDTCLLVIKNTVQDCSHDTGNLALRWWALICVLKQCSSCGYFVFTRDYQKLKPKSVASYTPDIFVPEWQLPFTNPARHLEVGQLTNPWLVQ